MLDYVARLMDDFVELHGDRGFVDDPAIVGGLARFDGRTIVLVGHQKGRHIPERMHRNFGMTYPEGYRKAIRVMEMADRHRFRSYARRHAGRVPGRHCRASTAGGGSPAAQLFMARLGVLTVACVIGQGGSGGAVAIALADRAPMQENVIDSVISPEAGAAILWRDAGEAKKPAAASSRTPSTARSSASWTASSPSRPAAPTRTTTKRRGSSRSPSRPRWRRPSPSIRRAPTPATALFG